MDDLRDNKKLGPCPGLRLSTLDKHFNGQHFKIFFLFFPENRIRRFMQIVSKKINKKNIINLSSDELA